MHDRFQMRHPLAPSRCSLPHALKVMIRIYQHGDHEAIAQIFTRAIHEIASEAYSPEQCLAWSSKNPNPEHWKKRCELKRPFVALAEGVLSGFLELDPDGHIDCAYVNPDFRRRGIISALVRHAVETCTAMNIHRMTVDASICARPLFEHAGFVVICEKTVTIDGVILKNFAMERISQRAAGS